MDYGSDSGNEDTYNMQSGGTQTLANAGNHYLPWGWRRNGAWKVEEG